MNDRARRALDLILLDGYPLNLACWVLCGMNRGIYGELKSDIKEYIADNNIAIDSSISLERQLNCEGISNIIGSLKIRGLWRNMPRSEYREMISLKK